jgi:hypothetical protein
MSLYCQLADSVCPDSCSATVTCKVAWRNKLRGWRGGTVELHCTELDLKPFVLWLPYRNAEYTLPPPPTAASPSAKCSHCCLSRDSNILINNRTVYPIIVRVFFETLSCVLIMRMYTLLSLLHSRVQTFFCSCNPRFNCSSTLYLQS